MRVLYIITQGEHGGGQKNVLDLSLGMHKKGHDVYVAVGDIENEGDKWLHTELNKHGIKKEKLFEIKNLQREVKIFRDLKSVSETISLIKKVKPNVVHLHSSKAGVVGATASFIYNRPIVRREGKRVKSVYTVHGFVFLEPMNVLKKIFYILIELFSSFFRDFTILISEMDVEAGKKYQILRNKKKYKVIHNGLDEHIKLEMLDKKTAREYLINKIPPIPYGKISAPIVGTISNLYKTKGLEYLIDAAKKVVDARKNTLFVVLGFGEEKYKKELEDRIRQNGLENNFFLLGKIPNAFKYLKGFSLFTLTSVKEGLPYTLLEAKMAGIPVLASSVGGIPEMAKNIPMNLVPAKNVDQIADKIMENIKNPPQVTGKLPETYSIKNMLHLTEGVYKHMLE